MKEMIVKMTGHHIKVKGGEYVQDIVRCKECKWRVKWSDGSRPYCDLNCRVEDLDGTESDLWFYIDDNDYCSRGVRADRKE